MAYARALPDRAKKRYASFVAVAVFGVATVAFGLSQNFYLSLAALLVTGASDMISVFVRSSLINFATPDPMRGRVGR